MFIHHPREPQRNPRGPEFYYGYDDVGASVVKLPTRIFGGALLREAAGDGSDSVTGACAGAGYLDERLTETPDWYNAVERQPLRKFVKGHHPRAPICTYRLRETTLTPAYREFIHFHEQGHILFNFSKQVKQMVWGWLTEHPILALPAITGGGTQGDQLISEYVSQRIPLFLQADFREMQEEKGMDSRDPRYQEALNTALSEIFADLWGLNRLRHKGADVETVCNPDVFLDTLGQLGAHEYLPGDFIEDGLDLLRKAYKNLRRSGRAV